MALKSSACVYRELAGEIQEYVLHVVSRQVVEDMFDFMEEQLREMSLRDKPNFKRPILMDSSIGIQPLNPCLVRSRALTSHFPETRKARIAIILPPSLLLKSVSMMMRPIAPVRFYRPDERDQALAWLRESSL